MIYEIKKGKHYSGIHLGTHNKKRKETYYVTFFNDCLYIPDANNHWNKLCGWTYGLFNDDNNIRVGWRATKDGRIELCLYLHKNGNRITSEIVFTAIPSTMYKLELWCDENMSCLFVWSEATQKGIALSLPYGFKPTVGYLNYPYFGGEATAPHNMRIALTKHII